jgi:pyruvate/2-oxoglutarate dehydrogenase complex dihydrolipoamide dehydrogenase (E3) component
MRRFGSKVTIIDRNGRLMSREDPDVCEALRSLLADEGIDILLNARIKQVSGKSGHSVSVVVEQDGIERALKGSHVLVATGRKPNTEGLGLELTGVELTDRGYIKVNERLQTTAPGVWAIGEVAGSPQFTHISVDDFRVVHANLIDGNRVTTGRQVPYCLFTDPELARIGLSETEAGAQGIAYRLFKVPMETNLRARTLSETRGFVKALVEANSDRILGFTAFGVGDPGRRPDCDDRGAALHRAARCGPDSPNAGRRAHSTVLIRGVSAQGCRDERCPDFRRVNAGAPHDAKHKPRPESV